MGFFNGFMGPLLRGASNGALLFALGFSIAGRTLGLILGCVWDMPAEHRSAGAGALPDGSRCPLLRIVRILGVSTRNERQSGLTPQEDKQWDAQSSTA